MWADVKKNSKLVLPQVAFVKPYAHTTARRGSLSSPPIIPDFTPGGQAGELRGTSGQGPSMSGSQSLSTVVSTFGCIWL